VSNTFRYIFLSFCIVFSHAWGSISTVQWQHFTPSSFDPSENILSQAEARGHAQEAERRHAVKVLELAQNIVLDLERRMGLTESWTPEHPDRIAAMHFVRHHKFIRAVDRLEGLVVSRLFELSKANLMGTCTYYLPFAQLY
jgi:hypothetical protein